MLLIGYVRSFLRWLAVSKPVVVVVNEAEFSEEADLRFHFN